LFAKQSLLFYVKKRITTDVMTFFEDASLHRIQEGKGSTKTLNKEATIGGEHCARFRKKQDNNNKKTHYFYGARPHFACLECREK